MSIKSNSNPNTPTTHLTHSRPSTRVAGPPPPGVCATGAEHHKIGHDGGDWHLGTNLLRPDTKDSTGTWHSPSFTAFCSLFGTGQVASKAP